MSLQASVSPNGFVRKSLMANIKKPAEGSLRVRGVPSGCVAEEGSLSHAVGAMSHDMGLMYSVVR